MKGQRGRDPGAQGGRGRRGRVQGVEGSRVMRKTYLPLLLFCVVGCSSVLPDGTRYRNAGQRAFASFWLPGTGQFMNQQPVKGVLMLGLWVGAQKYGYSVDSYEAALVAMFGPRIWSSADAYVVANRLNMTEPLPRFPRPGYSEAHPAAVGSPLNVTLDPINRQLSASLCYTF